MKKKTRGPYNAVNLVCDGGGVVDIWSVVTDEAKTL